MSGITIIGDAQSIASCDPGDIVLGGGYILDTGTVGEDIVQLDSFPLNDNQWIAYVLFESSKDGSLQSFARCLDVTP